MQQFTTISDDGRQPAGVGGDPGWTRRRFLQTGSAAGILVLGGRFSSVLAEDASAGAAGIPGKNAGLIVHKADPPELETPLALLRMHRITPAKLLFVRNNQSLAGTLTLQPQSLADWAIEFSGLVDAPRKLALTELSQMEQVEHELVLQCSGNGRALFSQTAKTSGAQWSRGALGNVRFKGVPLRTVLAKLGVKVQNAARYLSAEGRDVPSKPDAADFEHSLPLADALAVSFLALELNGQPIPAVHGGPVRLVTPGYYGTMQVKWLSRLRFEAQESTNHHHVPRYRTPLVPIAPGSEFDATLDNSEPNWRMRIKSLVFSPTVGETVNSGLVDVRGVAWNDGTARIVAVDVSADDGAHWQRAALEPSTSPYAWQHWSTRIKLESGARRLMSRAVDALGRTQPLDGSVFWNPAGYTWNGVDPVEIQVR